PEGHDGLGLLLLGVTGDQVLPPETYGQIKQDTLRTVRGTVQADILKEDQAQNTCIFSTEFALRLMGDIQDYFNRNGVKNFTRYRFRDIISPRPAPTRSPSSHLRLPTASPSWSIT